MSMEASELASHVYWLTVGRHSAIGRRTVQDPGRVVDHNYFLMDEVLAAETTVKMRWWGVAYQMLHSIDC